MPIVAQTINKAAWSRRGKERIGQKRKKIKRRTTDIKQNRKSNEANQDQTASQQHICPGASK
jgi:hypothetical protein